MKEQVKLTSIFEQHGKDYCTNVNPDAEFIYASDLGVSYNDMSLHTNRFHRWTEKEAQAILISIRELTKKGIKIVDNMPKYKSEYFAAH